MQNWEKKPCYTHSCFLGILPGWSHSQSVLPFLCWLWNLHHNAFLSSVPNFHLYLFLCLDTQNNTHHPTSLWLLYFHCSDYISIYRKMCDYYINQLFKFVMEVFALLILGRHSYLDADYETRT